MKALVVYYSRTGNTKFVAEKIAQGLGADIEEVIDKKNRSGAIGWLAAGKDAARRNKTEIAETSKNPSEFDLIVVGTPNWVNKPSPAIRTYLSKYDLAGRKVASFCVTDGYSGGEKVIEEIRTLIPKSDSTEHLVLSKPTENKADTENKISEWCHRLRSS
jgi:flavodoxin